MKHKDMENMEFCISLAVPTSVLPSDVKYKVMTTLFRLVLAIFVIFVQTSTLAMPNILQLIWSAFRHDIFVNT